MTSFKSLALYLIASMIICAVPFRAVAAENIPWLTGTWHAKFKLQTRQGISDCGGTLTITQQNEHLFRGTFSWSVDPATGIRADVNRRVGQKGTESVLGLLAWDNKSISMADAGDKGYWSGQLVDDQTMKLIYTESQRHAAVFRATFVRKKGQAKPAE